MRSILLIVGRLPSASSESALTFRSSEDAIYGHHPLPPLPPPSLKRYPSTYDDPFSDGFSAYENPAHQEPNGSENPSIDRDNKLLSFSQPSFNYALLDYTYRRTSVSLLAQLHGMFFLAESPWAAGGDALAPPTELTCYRRNLFQITGSITLPRMLRYIMTEQGEQIPILGQELSISATESVEGNPVKIISVPWKTPAANTAIVEDKTEKEPPSIPLDLINGQEMDSEFANFPIAWKRLQFRIATANNGRRKELQQHFVVRLKVVASLATGAKIPICEVQSGPIIVRGRSPRNFQSRKDFPLSGSGSAKRQSMHLPTQPTRTMTGESSQNNNNTTANAIKTEAPPMSVASIQSYPYDHSELQISPDFFDWKLPMGQQGAMTALPADPMSYPGAPYAQSSPDYSRNPRSLPPPPSAPINLSLTDEEPKKPDPPSETPRKSQRLNHVAPRAPSFSLNLISSPDESADLLYEYFPLGLDDWMPPVDAVYRPHVVHHTNLPPDPKAAAVKNKSKRYFSEDQG
ncbi:hypothetical protein LTR04_005687 [Oleoguttula sp. CCFEE 6159]|nr:hypothetical protein LTR04_005687 [Oleoguttula sp. CCFEE 6159]